MSAWSILFALWYLSIAYVTACQVFTASERYGKVRDVPEWIPITMGLLWPVIVPLTGLSALINVLLGKE